jgi:hypothetical protein
MNSGGCYVFTYSAAAVDEDTRGVHDKIRQLIAGFPALINFLFIFC